MINKKQIFTGIRVLDFCQVIAGSYATTMLGDMGAEIIKVEQPTTGDSLRNIGPMLNGESGFFQLNNRNKKSICVDLKTTGGISLVKDLILHCDVVTENFKPGVMKNFGLDYDSVKKIKPDIIYASVSGYGHNNDYSARTAYDLIMQAETGLASLNNFPGDAKPQRSPLSVADYGAGSYCAFAISAALFHKKNAGVGQYIDVAMYDSLISYMDNTFVLCESKQEEIERGQDLESLGLESTGNRHPETSPHGIYKTKDGHIAHLSLTNVMWEKLLKMIGSEQYINHPDFKTVQNRRTNWREVDKIVESWTSQYPTEQVVRAFNENKLPVGKVKNINEVFNDPHNDKREVFHQVDHPVAGKIKITNTPIKFSETPAVIHTAAPSLGEHNGEILKNILGYTQQKIDDLIEKRIVYKSE